MPPRVGISMNWQSEKITDCQTGHLVGRRDNKLSDRPVWLENVITDC